MATTSRPLGSTRSLASGVGCGAVIVVYTAQKIDIEKGIFRRDMFRCYLTSGTNITREIAAVGCRYLACVER